MRILVLNDTEGYHSPVEVGWAAVIGIDDLSTKAGAPGSETR